MKYIKLFESEYPNTSDIETIEDLFQEYIDKWALVKIEKPIYSYWFNDPKEKVYRIRYLPFESMLIEISIGYIVYDGVYEIEDCPSNDFQIFSNRLKKFGYEVGPIKKEWCDSGYTSKYINPERHSDLKPECEFKTMIVSKKINESFDSKISIEDVLLFIYYCSYTKMEILKKTNYQKIFTMAGYNDDDFVIVTEKDRKEISNKCLDLLSAINNDINLKSTFLNFMSKFKNITKGFPSLFEIEDTFIDDLENIPGVEYSFVIDDKTINLYFNYNHRIENLDFFKKIENRINLIFGNELDLQNYTKDNMIEVIITIYPK